MKIAYYLTSRYINTINMEKIKKSQNSKMATQERMIRKKNVKYTWRY